MPNRFYEIAFTPAVQHEQQLHGSRAQYQRMTDKPATNALGPDEQFFITLRDSFYMATVTESGWPYIQHRGGEPGFVHVLSPSTIAFADLRGNKQYISIGNIATNDRLALFFMDYPSQSRLKLFGHIEVSNDPALLAQLQPSEGKDIVERALIIRIEGFDWNCPQHITPRFSAAEIESRIAPLRRRISMLEEENAALRSAARDTLST